MPLLSVPAHALLCSLAMPPEDPSVQWLAPPECPDRDGLLTAVARRLGRPLAAAEVTIDAGVTGDARG